MAKFPSAIIQMNNDYGADSVLELIKIQLYIDEVIDGDTFALNLSSDPDYIAEIRRQNKKILVLQSADNYTNRTLMDVVLFVKNGLANVEKNNFGPPSLALTLDHIYLHKLMRFNKKLI